PRGAPRPRAGGRAGLPGHQAPLLHGPFAARSRGGGRYLAEDGRARLEVRSRLAPCAAPTRRGPMNTTVLHDPGEHRIRELFDRAVDLPADQWEPFLARECPDDPGGRDEVLRILRGTQRADAEQFLDRPTEDRPTADPEAIGKYQDIRRLSEVGGQAT